MLVVLTKEITDLIMLNFMELAEHQPCIKSRRDLSTLQSLEKLVARKMLMLIAKVLPNLKHLITLQPITEAARSRA
jgi:hypothetical protein